MGEKREKDNPKGLIMLLIVLALVFIGIPIAHSNSEEHHGRTVYSTSWSEEKAGAITAIDRVELYRTEKIVDGGYDHELAVSFRIENTTGHSIYATPEEGMLIIGKAQMNADPSTSDNFGGEILSGAISEGKVRFQLKDNIDLSAIKKIRLSWNQSHGKTNSEKYDITVNLEK
ncbi:hypothetical protein [Peribacillus glennii]|uniref:hypothetical protein n=1 Tax=Peribacillus glennii TaxID=2303991 RepID=UPI00115E3D6F|nr:hypothetical protein [Peribacillus glennii]